MTEARAAPLAPRAAAPVAIALGASIALHVALFAAILTLHAPAPVRRTTPVSVEIVESRPAPPAPAAPARVEEPPAPTRPIRPAPRTSRAPAPPPQMARPPRSEPPAAPEAPAPDTAATASPRIGISMSSTTAAGTYAAPVGSAAGEARAAGDASRGVRPSGAERYAAPSEVSSLPMPIRVELPKSEYPADARRDGIEGVVRLRLVVDEEGTVREATVVSDPGHGLGAAAARAAKRWFRFRPARKDGVPVATEIPFTVEFQLQ